MKGLITATSFILPKYCITNDELVNSYNEYVKKFYSNDKKQTFSDSSFIYKASGIRKRFVHDKDSILDINRMHPRVKKRTDDLLSLQCEFAVTASKKAIKSANINPIDIDAIIVSCSNFQRSYPGIAVELQNALGIKNAFSFDMNTGCSSAVVGISMADSLINSGLAKRAIVVTPELYTFHMNFRDRKSHFIFGDGCSAVIVENAIEATKDTGFLIKSAMISSKFSNNIRNNFGFMNSAEDDTTINPEKLFSQDGKKVRAEVVDLVVNQLNKHIIEENIPIEEIKKLWLHQANININKSIAERFFASKENPHAYAPTTLEKYANTGASGVIGCFSENNGNLNFGDKGIICAFGAGYHVANLLVEKVKI